MQWRSAARIGGCCARFAAVYTLLMVPWPVLVNGYSTVYRHSLGQLAASLSLGDAIDVRPAAKNDPPYDLEISVRRGGSPRSTLIPHSSRYPVYMSLAFFAALLAATPLRPRQWLRVATAGCVLLAGSLCVRVGAGLYLMAGENPLAWFRMEPLGQNLLIILAMGPWYLLPALIWAGLAYRPIRKRWIGPTARALARHESCVAKQEEVLRALQGAGPGAR